MSQSSDSDDFLGWAPDLGLWDAPSEPAAVPTAPPPAVAVPPPPPPPVRRPAPVRPPARTAPPPTPQQLPVRRTAPRSTVPVLVAFAISLLCALYTALVLAGSDSRSSPVMLVVWGLAAAVLGRVAWVRGRR